jgi:hypothetical protein
MQTIATSEEFRGCEITAGDAFEIVAPGDVLFQGWRSIVLRNGFSVATGGVFAAVIGVP